MQVPEQFLTVDWWSIVMVLCFVMFDLVSGIGKAAYNRDIQSGAMFDGLIRKCAIVGVILLAILCEMAMHWFPLPFDVPMVVPVCVFIILMEVSSIIENLTAINPQLKDNALLALFTKQERED